MFESFIQLWSSVQMGTSIIASGLANFGTEVFYGACYMITFLPGSLRGAFVGCVGCGLGIEIFWSLKNCLFRKQWASVFRQGRGDEVGRALGLDKIPETILIYSCLCWGFVYGWKHW
jgi:hypothetical protein